ncbi:hypothetical protein PGT21_003603 [Puccinia graminis f. sp. tritici]|uniref:Uncharacterized protein n=1 Tax=Puccinia graminis f. sp. tritici TaxID=56615 RepID=A0A5B0MTV7_PUCGR|nr:hypothetical protein PGT21_003603 [Puccinia graminis f. sp. tritici]
MASHGLNLFTNPQHFSVFNKFTIYNKMRSCSVYASLITIAWGVIAAMRPLNTFSKIKAISSPVLHDNRKATTSENYSLLSLSKKGNELDQASEHSRDHFLQKLAKDSPFLSSLKADKCSKMIKNWKKNWNEVISTYKDSRELVEIQSQIQNQFNLIKSNPFHDPREVSLSIELFETSKRKISLLTQWNLLKLGELDLYSELMILDSIFENSQQDNFIQKFINESNRSNPNQMWEEFGCSLMNEMKELVTNCSQQFNSLELVDPNPDFAASKYIIKTMNFLYKHSFINQELVRTSFQEEGFLRNVIQYILSYLKDSGEEEDYIWKVYVFITNHPCWSLMSEVFQVLSEKEIRNLNQSFLSEKVKFFGKKLNQVSLSPPWKTGLNYFSSQGKMSKWEGVNDTQKPRYLNGKETIQIPPSFNVPKELKDDIKHLTHILIKIYGPATANSQNTWENLKLSHAIFQYLDFIERNYHVEVTREIPGEAITRNLLNHVRLQSFIE